MIRKLLCWLGWHEWIYWENTRAYGNISVILDKGFKCKHCGKVKR